MIEWNEYDIKTNLTVDIILDMLKNDLIKRKRISVDSFDNMGKHQL